MSAPSHAPTLVGDVLAPDVSSIVTEDDTPVANFFSEKQRRCLTEPIYTSWEGPPPEEDGLPRPFVAAANVGVFGTPTDPPVVPDVLLSVDASFADDVLAKEDRTYYVWKFGTSPDLVIEVVSKRVRAEQERVRAEQADARAEQERARAARLADRLRAMGIDPEGE